MLYPRNSETREVVDIGGIWRFSVDKENQGLLERWYEEPLENTVDIPVPSSYNDLFVDASVRDHIGLVWYERTVFYSEILAGPAHRPRKDVNPSLIYFYPGKFRILQKLKKKSQ